eukprot:GHVN01069892.1.p1 GENE.GHVN01069892.1~~GHVN01069892.1.p1  ORF type:complete len:247 (+),score=43.49 GHVN01069892.1:482-1222(+)
MNTINWRDLRGKTALDYAEDKWEGKEILVLCGALTGEEIEQQIQEELDYQKAQAKKKKKKDKKARLDEEDKLSAVSTGTAGASFASSSSSSSSSAPQIDELQRQQELAKQLASEMEARARERTGSAMVERNRSIGDQGGSGETGAPSSNVELSIEEQLRLAEEAETKAKEKRAALQKLILGNKESTGEMVEKDEEPKGFWEACCCACCCPCCCGRPGKPDKPKAKAKGKARPKSSSSSSSSAVKTE